MKLFNYLTGFLLLFGGCVATAQENDLSPKDFSEKMANTQGAILLDVRTPGEYSKGFIGTAKNMDVRDEGLDAELAKMDKSQPYFVYCLGGSRSREAIQKMKAAGFTNIYHLKDGMLSWRKAGLPVNELETFEDKISLESYQKMTAGEMVLVDFYAPWCGPCRKMEPYFDEIANHFTGKVKVVRINIDENKNLAALLNVMEIPVVKRYQHGRETWESRGFTSREDLLNAVKP